MTIVTDCRLPDAYRPNPSRTRAPSRVFFGRSGPEVGSSQHLHIHACAGCCDRGQLEADPVPVPQTVRAMCPVSKQDKGQLFSTTKGNLLGSI